MKKVRNDFEMSIVNLLLVFNICAGIFLYTIREYIFSYIFIIPENIYITILILPSMVSFSTIIHAKLRLNNRAIELSILLFFESVVHMLSVIFLFTFVKIDIFYIFLSMVLKNCFALFYYFVFMNRFWKFQINFKDIRESFLFSFNLIPGTLGYYFSHMADRFMLKKFVGEKEVGIYTAVHRISSVAIFIVQPLYTAFSPIIIRDFKKKDFKKEYFFILFSILSIVFTLISFVTLFERELILLIAGQKYVIYSYLFGFFLLIEVLLFISKFFVLNIHLSKKSIYSTMIEIICGILNIILNVALILQYGLFGAVSATIITFFIRFLLYLYFANTLYRYLAVKYSYILSYISSFG